MIKYFFLLAIFIDLGFSFLTSAYAQSATEYVHLGNVSGRQEKYKQAILDYSKAINLDPKLANAYYNRGYVYIEIRKYKLAIADLDKAIEIKPDYAAAYHLRGVAHFLKKKYTQAISDYSKAIGLEPENIKFYDSRLGAYFKLGNNDKAWEDVIKIQQLGGAVNPAIINLLKNKKYRD